MSDSIRLKLVALTLLGTVVVWLLGTERLRGRLSNEF